MDVHCEGCQKKVQKVLQKIHGVYSINIDAEQGKVTVSGTVDPYILIMMLAKAGKKAQLLLDQRPPPPAPAPTSPAHNPNQLEFMFENMLVAPHPEPAPPVGPIQQKSSGGPFAQLQQLAQFKRLKHLEFTQSRGIKMTFRGEKNGKNHDQRMKLIPNDGHGAQMHNCHGPQSCGPTPFGCGHGMNNMPPSYHVTCGVGPLGSHSARPPAMPTGPPPGPPPPPANPPWGPPLPPTDLFTNVFSDEHPNGCIVM
ncbi:hypothetical protein L1049_003110 [Liquidambar formosana]|uniref:HMA domain-containing protein n=1 Tax=Liquidambar formosana TaxID=63359 RepID=A0AAP0NGW3_LIQFO